MICDEWYVTYDIWAYDSMICDMILWKLSPSFSSKDHPAKLQLQRLVVGSASNNFRPSDKTADAVDCHHPSSKFRAESATPWNRAPAKWLCYPAFDIERKHKYMEQTRLKMPLNRKSLRSFCKAITRNPWTLRGSTGKSFSNVSQFQACS